jgi:hypothetical protein
MPRERLRRRINEMNSGINSLGARVNGTPAIETLRQ